MKRTGRVRAQYDYRFLLSKFLPNHSTTMLLSYMPRNKENLHGCVCFGEKKNKKKNQTQKPPHTTNASLALQSFTLIPSLAFIFFINFVSLQCLRFLFNLSITPQHPLSQLSTSLLLYMQPMSCKHARRPNTSHLGTS